MANFLKESIAELEHVVWPTHIETKKFFQAVVWIIVGMTLFTYVLTVLFSNSIFGVRSMLHTPTTADLSNSPIIQPIEVKTEDGGTLQVEAEPVAEKK